MTPQGKAIWNSPRGVSLLEKMLSGEPKDAKDKLTLAALKKQQPQPPKKG